MSLPFWAPDQSTKPFTISYEFIYFLALGYFFSIYKVNDVTSSEVVKIVLRKAVARSTILKRKRVSNNLELLPRN